MAIGAFTRRAEAAGGDDAGLGAVIGDIVVPARAGARPSGRMPTRWRGGPLSSWSRIGGAAGEIPVQFAALADRPGQAGLDRAGQFVEVVAIEAQPGLQPQRVARAEAGGDDLGLARAAVSARRFGAARPGRKFRTRPPRCSRSGRRSSRCRSMVTAATPMNGSAAASGASRAITAAACGPCSASSARSACADGDAGGQVGAQMGEIDLLAAGVDHEEQTVAAAWPPSGRR